MPTIETLLTDQTVMNARLPDQRSSRPIPIVLSGVRHPSRMAAATELARLVPCSVMAAAGMLRRCGEDGEAALRKLRQNRAAHEARARREDVARASGFSLNHLRHIARREGLLLDELAEWARTHSHGITVKGNVYQSRAAYVAALSRQQKVSVETLRRWLHAGISLEDLADKAKEKQPPFRRHGEVSAYGWRWASLRAFSIYYFGYAGARARVLRLVMHTKPSLSLGMAAREYILRLPGIGKLGPDCRWSPEHDATMPEGCLPINAHEDRLPDERNILRVRRDHARPRITACRTAAAGGRRDRVFGPPIQI